MPIVNEHRTGASTRVAAERVSERERRIAMEVRRVAAELGAYPAQVAIAWTMHERGTGGSPRVHPIIGARTTE